ncbi:MAG: HEAT repeat domain-containing protein [Bacteroidota bacterium]|nr:HEAT repeat domain-containing protein [Bacteroidota bacterium]
MLPSRASILGVGLLLLCAACSSTPTAPPYSPEEALETFQLPSGFRIDLVAAEPLIADPVAMDIDEFGRIFVAEMPGYPLDAGGTGRIKLLRDTDGDGQPDAATLFADGLRLPTGLMRWKEGVLVTDPPDLLYLADHDDDGVADERTAILTGFALSNAQHNANKPLYGLDNWIYIANNAPIWWTRKYADPFGDQGGELFFPEDSAAARLPRNGSDRNIRLKPDVLELEALSSRSQFGQTFDPWGRHFLVDNSHHHYHEVIAARYFEGNDRIPIAQAIHRTPDHGDAAEVFAITRNPEHQLLTDRGVFTSACALTWYAGGLFPAPYAENVTFVAEPVHNLVHADQVIPNGPVFTARRIERNREFLASTDSWFRPVNFSIGPDGALYLVDYYRQIVEHPEWMDDRLADEGNLTRGTDRGRIYRIVPDNAAPMDWHDQVNLGSLPAAELVAALESPNRWHRMQAQRLMVSRKDSSTAPQLIDLAQSSAQAEARVHALWTLNGLGRLSASTVRSALNDDHPRVRENALVLAEQFPAADLVADLAALVTDPDRRVRFQLINTLGKARSEDATVLHLLWQDLNSDWIQAAALLAYQGDVEDLMAQALVRSDLPPSSGDRLIARLAAIIAENTGLIPALTRPGSRRSARLNGAADGLERSSTPAAVPEAVIEDLLSLVLSDQTEAGDAALRVMKQLELPALSVESEALALAADSTADSASRARAAELLALTGSSLEVLGELLGNNYPASAQQAVLKALELRPGLAAARLVLEQWPTLTPTIRRNAPDVFNSQDRADLLVTALETGRILPHELLWQHRVRLMRDTDEPVRSRARALLELPPERTGDEPALQTGDEALGKEVFLSYCAQCHQAGAAGAGTMGPDLATVQHWPTQALLNEITDPSRSIASGYEQWRLQLQNGDAIQGVVTQETPVSVTVETTIGSRVLRRDRIQGMIPVVESAMPPNLHLTMTDAELAGLLTFITEFTGATEGSRE